MNQNIVKWLVIGICSIVLFFLVYKEGKDVREEDRVQETKYYTCTTASKEAIPDPNETESLAKFLKECLESKQEVANEPQ